MSKLKRTRGWAGVLGPVLAAGVLFVALAAYLAWVERGLGWANAPADGRVAGVGGERARLGVTVDRLARTLKLVTVEVDAVVTASVDHESWRGDVSAAVSAPVRYYYGTDLTQLREGDVSFSPLLDTYSVRVGTPQRLAVEVRGDAELATQLKLGWARFRSVSGEYYLGLARRGLYEAAAAQRLTPEQIAMVEQATREQISGLVRALAGRADVGVDVRFEERALGALGGQAPGGAADSIRAGMEGRP